MIFGEDFGQLAASGEYEVYKKGTTVAQLEAAINGLSDEEYLDSFLTISDDSGITTENNILLPFRASTRLYLCDMSYPTGSIMITTYYTSGSIEEVTKTISSGALVRTSKSTSGTGASLLTLNSWTLYRRQKSYDVAISGSKAAQAIAPVQDTLAAANRNYAVGAQFYYDGHLYKATASISSGAQIVIGTNAVLADDIVTQMNSIPSSSLKEVTFTNANAVSIAANGTVEFAVSTSATLTGYSPMGLTYLDTGSANVAPTFYMLRASSSFNVDLKNLTSSAITLPVGSVKIKGMFIKVS